MTTHDNSSEQFRRRNDKYSKVTAPEIKTGSTSGLSVPSVPPRRTAGVIGAGIVGLSSAWFLQEYGYEVVVFDPRGPGGGSSRGNAGWLSPGLTFPLPEPSVLAYGFRSLASRDAALRIPPTATPRTWAFLLQMALNCRTRPWRRGIESFKEICSMALESYDALKEGGVESPVYELPLFAAFENHQHSESLRHELEMQTKFGNPVSFVEMGGAELRSVQPILSDTVDFGLRIDGQKFVHPGEFTDSLALSVQARGGRIAKESVTGVKILADSRPQVQSDLGIHSFDDVVIATGAWISRLGRAAGMRRSVGSGRGYSFSVASDIPLTEPIYLPRVRVAASIDPTSDHRFRLAGTMEFHPVDHPLIEERISAIVRSCAPYLRDVDWTSIEDQWVGSRPLTTDGLPVIGATEVDHVFLSGGHGMWGMTLGPASGRLLAELIATTSLPQALLPFDPLR